MNFENYDGTVTADKYATAFGGATVNTGTAYAGVYGYEADGTATPTLSIDGGTSDEQLGRLPEPSRRRHAWGMGGGVWMGCADASAYKGISFWVRGSSGTGTFSFTHHHGEHAAAGRHQLGRRRDLPGHHGHLQGALEVEHSR